MYVKCTTSQMKFNIRVVQSKSGTTFCTTRAVLGNPWVMGAKFLCSIFDITT